MSHDPTVRYRSAHVDSLEERLVLSAQPAMELYLDSFLTDQVETKVGDLSGSIADVHEFTGVAAVREEYQLTGSGQTIAVIDTGIAYDHYALGGGLGQSYRVVGGWDFAENDADPYDDGPAGFHGTHVAGIVGSSDSQHLGVAPDADLVALRVFDDLGRATFDWVESALRWVHEHRNDFENPITTVNLSLGADWNQDVVPNWAMLEDEFAQLKADGVFISVAAGNSFAKYQSPGLSYPAASPLVVPVASVGADGELSDFSQRNNRVIAAPGEAITSTIPNHLYGDSTPSDRFLALSGTSMAAPYLAGSSMLLRDAMESAGHTDINQDTLYERFRETADQIWDTSTQSTYLRLNLRAAIESVFSDPPTREQPPATDLGVIDDQRFNVVEIDGTQFYQLRAMRDGVLAVAASTGEGGVQLAAFDEQMNRLNESVRTDDGLRLDFAVSEGDVVLLRMSGNARDIDLHFSNVIEQVGHRLIVHGTAHDDALRVELADELRIQFNGLQYSFDYSDVHSLHIFGNQGQDELFVKGTLGSDIARVQGQNLRWVADDFRLKSRQIEHYELDGGGGIDQLRIRDTAGDDHVSASQKVTTAQGREYFLEATSFDQVRAFGGEGRDTGDLQGSSESDRFVGRSGNSVLSSTAWRARMFNFDSIRAEGGGGNDLALVHGTTADEVFTITTDFGHLQSEDYAIIAENFTRTVLAGNGGNDTLVHSSSINREDFTNKADRTVIRGEQFWFVIREIDVAQSIGLQQLGQLSSPSAQSGSQITVEADGNTGDSRQVPIGIPGIATHHYSTIVSLTQLPEPGRHLDTNSQALVAAAHSELLGDNHSLNKFEFEATSAYQNELSPYFWDLFGPDHLCHSHDVERHRTEAPASPILERDGRGEETFDEIRTAIEHESACLEFVFGQIIAEESARRDS